MRSRSPRIAPRLLFALALALAATARPARAESTVPIDGEVPDDGSEFAFVPFEVPSGTAEIEVEHDDLSSENILDWGLYSPGDAFRGWGGGNSEPAIVGEHAASRSYLAGPIAAGTWKVVIGKAQIKAKPARYRLVVHLREAPTLAPQPERRAYEPAAPLSRERRWYAGDLHVHSRESGDAKPSIDAIADFARSRGLDFVELSDHNTVSQLDFLGDAQARHPDLLLVPGVEYTTYAGHANGIGATTWVDHKIGLPGVTIDAAGRAFAAQGAVLSLNHPLLDLGDACIGCAWKHELDPSLVGGIEICTGAYSKSGQFFVKPTLAMWNEMVRGGHHVAAVGGSDDHSGGADQEGLSSPIGSPTTMVYADELSVPAIVDAIRKGRTVVKLDGPSAPMIELASDVEADGDTVRAATATWRAVVTGGEGLTLRFLRGGVVEREVDVTSDPFTAETTAAAPESGADPWRAEVWDGDKPRTITSHLWIARGAGGAPATPSAGTDDAGGSSSSCSHGPTGGAARGWAGLLVLGALVALRRGRATKRSRPWRGRAAGRVERSRGR